MFRPILYFLITLFCINNSYCLSENSWALIEKITDTTLDEKRIQYIDLQIDKVQQLNKNSWCSDEKTELLILLAELVQPKKCVEIGVFTGSSLLPLLHTMKHNYHGEIYAIDSWSTEDILEEILPDDPNYSWWEKLDIDKIKRIFSLKMMNYEYEKFVSVLPKKSLECVNLVPNEIDFIHFHGNMGENHSLQDVQSYLPKVKSGGYILFSDLFCVINGQHSKMEALWYLMEHCDVIYEIESTNAVLLKKQS